MIRLDRNESYWMLDDELVAAVKAPSAEDLSVYPAYDELKAALAKYAGVNPEQVLVTAGSVGAIEHVIRTYTENGGEAILPVPTFYSYESILERAGAAVVPIAYEERDEQFVFPLEQTIAALKKGTAKALFLCHPSNPLGCPLTKEDITALVEAARGSSTMLISDEAYFEFSSGASFLPYLAELPNLVVLRTLSKAFGLAGARVGYIIAAPEVLASIGKSVLPWTVAATSAHAACALLGVAEKVANRREILIGARVRFMAALGELSGVTVYPSETNFVLLKVSDAVRAQEVLQQNGMTVALGEPMSRYPEAKALLRNTLRIAVPAPESLDLFIRSMRQALD
jgi:histidinol-phosphate aminotransferase